MNYIYCIPDDDDMYRRILCMVYQNDNLDWVIYIPDDVVDYAIEYDLHISVHTDHHTKIIFDTTLGKYWIKKNTMQFKSVEYLNFNDEQIKVKFCYDYDDDKSQFSIYIRNNNPPREEPIPPYYLY